MAPKRERTVSPPTTTTTTTSTTQNINSIHSSNSSSPMKLTSSSSPPTASTSNLNQKSSPQPELSRSPTSTPPKQLNNNSNSLIITDNNKPITSTSTTTSTSPRNSPTTNTTSLPSTTPPRTNVNSSPSSASSNTSSNSNSSSPSSNNNKSNSSPTARRVKLYRLHEDQWIDLGTGSCVGNFIESTSENNIGNQQQQHEESEGAYIVVTKEPETGKPSEIILRSKIQPYPSGYLSDEDDEEENGNGNGGGSNGNNKVLDQGGYQRQQETLIVWTDKETDIEMALSFATTAGCTEIWEFIKAARKWSEHIVASPSISSPSSPPQPFPLYSLTKLPEPSLGNIDQVELSIRSIGRTAAGRERTAITIIKGNYIQKLIKIQEEAEDLESLEDLHALCRVMQTILLLNDNVIFDLILRDEIVLGVASILEYDPEFPTMKASYRSHLSDLSQFTEIVPIRSPTLLAKIHQTHRLHYFKDVVLARILEDSTFSMLNSAIYFNEVDIVNEVASDTVFLKALFAIFDEEEEEEEGGQEKTEEDVSKEAESEGLIGPSLPVIESSIGPQLPAHLVQKSTEDKMDVDDSTTSSHFLTKQPTSPTGSIINLTSPIPTTATASSPPIRDRKHDAILFLQQFSSMAKNLQLPARAAFFRNLADKGLLRVIEVALSRTITLQDPQMRGATIEILMMLVDHDPNNVRGYSLKQHGLGKRPLVVFLIELFHTELDLGLKAQMSEALRVLVDAGGNGGPLEAPPRLRPEDPEAEKFLQYFYDHCILSLLAPILALPEQSSTDPPLDLPPHSVALSAHLCDLLCFFVSHHTFRSKYFVLSTSISTNVAKLFRARPKHLRLAALRYFRACVGKNDDFYNRFLIKNSLLDPILDMSLEERGRDNLLSSACLEFFEYVRSINAKALINHLMERKGDTIRALSKEGLITFGSLIVKWEQNNEPPPSAVIKPAEDISNSATPTSKGMSRDRGGNWTRMDTEEEESYFNGSDEEEDSTTTATPASTTPSKKREGDPTENLSAGKKLKLDGSSTNSTLPGGGSLSRSQTWPSDTSKGKGKSLVEYGDDDEEEDGEIGPGGFIREKSDPLSSTTDDLDPTATTTTTSSTDTSDSTTSNLDRHTREAAPPPPSPSESGFPLSTSLSSPIPSTNGTKPLPLLPSEELELSSSTDLSTSTTTTTSTPIVTETETGPPEFTPGELRRRTEAEEEDADSNGFLKLSSKGKKPLLAGGGTPAKSVLFGMGATKVSTGIVGTTSSTSTASNPIKISFGGFGKLLGGGVKEKELVSEAGKEKEKNEGLVKGAMEK